MEKFQVFVITYRVFVDAIQKNLISMSQLNVLVLDDCHNVMNDHALKNVLELYKASSNNVRPRILGLTASVVNNTCRPVELSQLMSILETNLESCIQTSDNILSALQ